MSAYILLPFCEQSLSPFVPSSVIEYTQKTEISKSEQSENPPMLTTKRTLILRYNGESSKCAQDISQQLDPFRYHRGVVRVAEIKQLLGFLCRMRRIRFHWLDKHRINATTIHIHHFKAIAAPLKIIASLRNTPQLQQHKTC